MCLNIACFPGKFESNDSCTPLLKVTKQLHYTMAFKLKFEDNSSANGMPTNLMMKRIVVEMNRYFTLNLGIKDPIKHAYVETQKKCSDGILDGSLEAKLFLVIFVDNSVYRHQLENGLVDIMNRTLETNQKMITQPSADAEYLPLRKNGPHNKDECYVYEDLRRNSNNDMDKYTPIRVSNTILCPYVMLQKDEYSLNETSSVLTLTRAGVVLSPEKYEIHSNGEVAICLKDLKYFGYFPQQGSPLWFEPMSRELWIVTVVRTTISGSCLLLGIVTYCIFPRLRTIPGIINIITFTTLLMSLFLTQFGMFIVRSDIGCSIYGICLHFSWFSVFTTMQVCNYHMYKVFHSTFFSDSSTWKLLTKYIVFSFGIPLLFIVINIAYSYISSSGTSPGYGGFKCFISNTPLLIITFLFPIGSILAINIIMYISTAVNIIRTPTVTSNKGNRDECSIIIRIISITGITWVLQMIDVFLTMSVFSIITTILSCLQGTFVFFAFVANKRVFKMYREKFSKVITSSSKPCTTHTTGSSVIPGSTSL